MDKLLTLFHLNKLVLQAKSTDEAVFHIVNKTLDLVSYDQAVLLLYHGDTLKSVAVSGNASIDPQSPHADILKAILDHAAPAPNKNKAHSIIEIKPEHIPPTLQDKWALIERTHNLVVILETQEEGRLGCLLLQREAGFAEPERTILEEVGEIYSHALGLQQYRGRKGLFSSLSLNNKTKKLIAVLLVLAFFIPVKLSITAPAEVIAEDSKTITAPFQGLIDTIDIKPGSSVKEGDSLVKLDREALKAEAQSAKQALELAQISLSRARRESLSDPQKKSEISRLNAEIKSRQIEYDYAQSLLERSIITSPQDGIAVFADTSALEGQPVNAGDKIMTIANPATLVLLIRVPVDAMLNLEKKAAVSFFANTAPLSNYQGSILNTAYQASPDPDGLLTYKIRAQLDKNQDLRIGWKGTAKIYSQWSILGYSVLRRPLIALRNITGF